MGDVVGRLFHEFAITLAATIVISAVVSLTLVPMLCAKLLKPTPPGAAHGDHATGGRFFQWMLRRYASALTVVLNHQSLTLLVALGTFFLTGYLYVQIPKGFFPIQDTGVIQGVTQASQAISFDKMAELQQELAKAILTDPDVESLSSFIGVDGSNITLNSGRILINLKPHAASQVQRERNHPPAATGDRRRRRHVALHAAGPGSLDRYRRQRDAISVHFGKPGPRDAAAMDAKVLERLGKIPEIVDVASDLQPNGRSVTSTSIAPAPRASASRRLRSTTRSTTPTASASFDDLHPVQSISGHPRHRPLDDAFAGSLNSIYLPSSASTTGQVPLNTVSKLEVKPSPLQISHSSSSR